MFFQRGDRVKVKICGIKDQETAKAAIDAGADALGFIFAPESKRYISPREAKEIIAAMPPGVDAVGVFSNAPRESVNKIAAQCNLSAVQLHGEEPSHYLNTNSLPVIKCVKVQDKFDLKQARAIKADAILLDTYHPYLSGGTGETFDWSLVKNAGDSLPLILAGGLTDDNVSTAVKTVRPCAVDVSSGVESSGVKDKVKIKAFVTKAKEVVYL